MQLAVLRRARFGRSLEKLNRDIEQLELLIGALEQDAAAEDARTSAAEPDMTTEPEKHARHTSASSRCARRCHPSTTQGSRHP